MPGAVPGVKKALVPARDPFSLAGAPGRRGPPGFLQGENRDIEVLSPGFLAFLCAEGLSPVFFFQPEGFPATRT